MTMTDNTQAVVAKKTTLYEFVVYKHGKDRSDIRKTKSPDVDQALWDAFGVSGLELDTVKQKYYAPIEKSIKYLVDLGGVVWAVKRITALQSDTMYRDCKVYA
jgi:hypothetical protein